MKMFVLLLILKAVLFTSLKIPVVNSSGVVQQNQGVIEFNADDKVIKILVNHKEIMLDAIANLGVKNEVKKISTPLKIGDEVSIVAMKSTSVTQSNPAMIIANIHYYNKEGVINLVRTSNLWQCNKKNAKVIGVNSDTKIWQQFISLASSTDFIWDEDDSRQVECTIKLYQPALRSEINIVVDNRLDFVKINGHKLTIKDNVDDINTVKNLKPYITTDDEIEIGAINIGGIVTESNPAAILASIRFINKFGEWQEIYTSNDWNCAGKPPKVYGNNLSESFWSIQRKKYYSEINPKASFIWASSGAESTSCKIVLKSEIQSGLIYLSASYYLSQLLVNEQSITINRKYVQDWTVTRLFRTLIKAGDKISIIVQKGSDPSPGIISTIKYYDSTNTLNEVSTSVMWQCNEEIPIIVPKETEACPEVSDSAEWIWDKSNSETVTCSIVLK